MRALFIMAVMLLFIQTAGLINIIGDYHEQDIPPQESCEEVRKSEVRQQLQQSRQLPLVSGSEVAQAQTPRTSTRPNYYKGEVK